MSVDWKQTNKNLTIHIPLSHKTSKENLDYAIAPLFIKINIKDPKLFKFIDLNARILIEESSIIIEDKYLVINLTKEQTDNWTSLEFKGTKEELQQRRKASENELYELIRTREKKAKQQKQVTNQFVVDKSIQIGNEYRKVLRDKKDDEKNEAVDEMYNFVNSYSNDKANLKEDFAIKSNINQLSSLDNNNIKQDIYPPIKAKSHQVTSTIFHSNEVPIQENEKNIHKLREPSKVDVTLTEKQIPHFAARESLSKEPPYPKSKKFVPEKNHLGQELDDRNPIWIKEKGDNFFKNNDFQSAINAYNQALELDSDFIKVLLNRSTAFLRLGNFNSAELDIFSILKTLKTTPCSDEDKGFYSRINIISHMKLYAIYAFKSEFDKALSEIAIISEEYNFIQPDLVEKIKYDKQMIIDRRNYIDNDKKNIEQRMKVLSSDKSTTNNYEDLEQDIICALDKQNNQNEKLLSNLNLLYFQNKNYSKVIEYSNMLIKLLHFFKDKIQLKKYDNSLEIKTLLRRAKSYQELHDLDSAQEDIASSEKLLNLSDNTDKTITNSIIRIKDDIKNSLTKILTNKANDCLSQKQFADALDVYNKIIQLNYGSNRVGFNNSSNVREKSSINDSINKKIENIKLYINRSSCYMSLLQYSTAISELNKVLFIIGKQKNIAILNNENIQIIDSLTNLEFISYVKRAGAYSLSQKYIDAINDYENALKIKEDITVRSNLNKIRIKNAN